MMTGMMGGFGGNMMGGGPGGAMMGWGGLFIGGLYLLLIVALIALAVVAAIYLMRRSAITASVQKEASGSKAESIAQERFARGELTQDEYNALISQLRR